ncbi:MAG: sigma-70 family RNA polymerase sigma factor [Ruminococcaceae bacterium]|nr:sigma-70 family RNA polymerase sigma factor [Oscillospiraceae bacterium]
MYKNKVFICGVDTSKLPLLKEKEKERLLKEVKAGSKLAREELINGNLRLVLSVIQRFTGRGENLDDLFQVGCIGLIKSIDNFDITQNVRFSTYAVPMVIECRNPRKDFESYDQKNRITKGNFATLTRPKEYRDLRETQRHFGGYAADELD